MADQQEGSSPLAAIFFLSIYSLLLIPFTIYRLCNAASSEDVVKPWEAVGTLLLVQLSVIHHVQALARTSQKRSHLTNVCL